MTWHDKKFVEGIIRTDRYGVNFNTLAFRIATNLNFLLVYVEEQAQANPEEDAIPNRETEGVFVFF